MSNLASGLGDVGCMLHVHEDDSAESTRALRQPAGGGRAAQRRLRARTLKAHLDGQQQ